MERPALQSAQCCDHSDILLIKAQRTIQYGIPAYKLLSVLNLSHASFNVLNTAALIIRCSVLASCGIYRKWLASGVLIIASQFDLTLSGCTLPMAFM
jgi:hypothetical protein